MQRQAPGPKPEPIQLHFVNLIIQTVFFLSALEALSQRESPLPEQAVAYIEGSTIILLVLSTAWIITAKVSLNRHEEEVNIRASSHAAVKRLPSYAAVKRLAIKSDVPRASRVPERGGNHRQAATARRRRNRP
jgi:hypothetical protein